MKNQNLLELINNIEGEVKKLGYSENSIKNYTKIWKNLKDYCLNRKIDNYTIDVGNAFLDEVYDISNTYYLEKNHHTPYRSIMMLNSYMCYSEIYTKYFLDKHILNNKNQNLLDEYLKFCSCTKSNASKTVGYKKYAIKRLLLLVEKEELSDFNKIDIHFIEKYLHTLIDISHNSMKLYIYTLRDFLNFLYETGKINSDIQYIIPTVKISKYLNIPSVWAKEDIKKLIDSIDINNPIGKRDYAMILLVAKLGIRVMDLKHLTINNIDWKKKEINYVTSKTKNSQTLPLPTDVGWAIINYLKNGRPTCDSDVIFIRHVSPIGPFTDSDSLAGIIKKYINLAGITFNNEIHKKGMHSLRHSLATNLLKNNIPIDSISSILSQDNKSSVSYYLKVDTDKLSECCGDGDFYGI